MVSSKTNNNNNRNKKEKKKNLFTSLHQQISLPLYLEKAQQSKAHLKNHNHAINNSDVTGCEGSKKLD